MIKLFLIILWFGLIPFGIGLELTKNRKEEQDSLAAILLMGYAAMLALFQLLCVPMTFSGTSFHVLSRVYGGAAILLFAVSMIRSRKRLAGILRRQIVFVRSCPLLMWAAFLLIAVQIGVYLVGMATDLDDAFYVATAGTTIRTDGLMTYSAYTGRAATGLLRRYALSPFPILLAFLSQAVQLHPTVTAHTLMPVFFVALAYGAYGLLGRKLFSGDDRSVGLFLCLVSLVHMFSYYSVYTQGTFMLIRIWQGKAFLASVLLPAMFYFAWQFADCETVGVRDWLGLFCLNAACCLASTMGIMLAPIMLGLLTLVLILANRRFRRLVPAILCCLPNIVCAAVFLLW